MPERDSHIQGLADRKGLPDICKQFGDRVWAEVGFLRQTPINQNFIMKTKCYLWAAMLLFAFFAASGHPAEGSGHRAGDDRYIVILHPTVSNISTLLYLTSEGILPVEPGTGVLGVYSVHGSYDYSLSADFIDEEGLDNVKLIGVEAPFDPDSLFSVNVNSDIFRMIFRMAQGIIFYGGPDIPPATYGGEMSLLTVVTDPHRHYIELSFLYHLLGGYQDDDFIPLLEENPELPVLGICLGMQTMNVATGGTLVQDIPFEIYGMKTVEQVLAMDRDQQHRNYSTAYRLDPGVGARSFHRILIEEESHMAIAKGGGGQAPYVLSSHHQTLEQTGKGFRITAMSMDEKIAEAIEHTRYPNVIGIQFHPEVNTLYMEESKITFTPGKEAEHSFLDLYPGESGEDFHRNFWRHFGSLLAR